MYVQFIKKQFLTSCFQQCEPLALKLAVSDWHQMILKASLYCNTNQAWSVQSAILYLQEELKNKLDKSALEGLGKATGLFNFNILIVPYNMSYLVSMFRISLYKNNSDAICEAHVERVSSVQFALRNERILFTHVRQNLFNFLADFLYVLSLIHYV